MQTRDFPFCCTAKILCDFGESSVSEGSNETVAEDYLRKNIIDRIVHVVYSHAFVTAVTNSDQKTAIRVLKELKFKSTRWMGKGQHPGTKVKMWWLPIRESSSLFEMWANTYKLEQYTKKTLLAIASEWKTEEDNTVYSHV